MGFPPRGDQVPSHEEGFNDNQAPASPPPLTDGDIRASLLHMPQDITTQAQ